MKTRLLHEAEGLRTFAVVLDEDDDPIPALETFAEDKRVDGAALTAVGAFSSATVAYFDPSDMEYRPIDVDEQVEVLSMVGDIAGSEEEPAVHAHVVLGRRDGSTIGGHLQSARVWPTLEVIVTETPAHLRKRHDPETGLMLIDLDVSG